LPVSVTVPVTSFPPFVLVGDTLNVLTSGGSTWSCVLTLEVACCAESVTKYVWPTGTVVTVNVADDDPWGIVSDPGIFAVFGYELESVTEIPPEGAGNAIRTTPCTDAPPRTELCAN